MNEGHAFNAIYYDNGSTIRGYYDTKVHPLKAGFSRYPVPFRGKTNEPGFVKHVAEEIARLRGCDLDLIARHTSENFIKLFNKIGI